jgi:hypothetical protein
MWSGLRCAKTHSWLLSCCFALANLGGSVVFADEAAENLPALDPSDDIDGAPGPAPAGSGGADEVVLDALGAGQ